ncbi:AroM family protein [Sporomusa aerivorans]|uniref:AroM family protein n=1 Tax=Sporomusa aerivorans TaxID=204936 RepID=UPI003529D92E
MLAVIRVLTSEDDGLLQQHGRIITATFGLETKSYCIPDQYQGVYNDATREQAIPKIVRLAQQAEREGAKAVLISCAADPGLEEARAACKLPVIGAGSALAAVGMAISGQIGVLNLTGPTPTGIVAMLGSRLVAEASPQGVRNTTELLTNKAAALAAAQTLLNQKAQVILLACTGYTTIGMADAITESLGCQVVDAVQAGGLMAQYILKARGERRGG